MREKHSKAYTRRFVTRTPDMIMTKFQNLWRSYAHIAALPIGGNGGKFDVSTLCQHSGVSTSVD